MKEIEKGHYKRKENNLDFELDLIDNNFFKLVEEILNKQNSNFTI